MLVPVFAAADVAGNGDRHREDSEPVPVLQRPFSGAPLHRLTISPGIPGTGRSVKVGNGVTSHEAWGLGSYCFFSANPGVVAAHALEVPNTAGVRFHDMVTVSLGGTGTISHVINTSGGAVNSGHQVEPLVSGP